ncbi:hypothetical protein MMC12_007145 [Toensbergia leucococca]|nr:hypothetical protein [Toensbergia leucococca]
MEGLPPLEALHKIAGPRASRCRASSNGQSEDPVLQDKNPINTMQPIPNFTMYGKYGLGDLTWLTFQLPSPQIIQVPADGF